MGFTISLRNGHGDPAHNDRSKGKGKNIDSDRTHLNEVYRQGGFHQEVTEEPLRLQELAKYKEWFSPWLDAQNAKHEARRQLNRVKNIEQVYESERYAPHEFVVQVGNFKDYPSNREIRGIMTEFVNHLQRRYRPNFRLLNATIHMDEATPHMHLRYVMCAHDKDGHLYPAFNKGLKELNIEPATRWQDEPQGKYNNRAIGFTDRLRDEFAEIAERYVGEITRGEHIGEKHQQGRDYIKARDKAHEERIKADLKEIEYRKQSINAVMDTIRDPQIQELIKAETRRRKRDRGISR